jgi:hypothetical protein
VVRVRCAACRHSPPHLLVSASRPSVPPHAHRPVSPPPADSLCLFRVDVVPPPPHPHPLPVMSMTIFRTSSRIQRTEMVPHCNSLHPTHLVSDSTRLLFAFSSFYDVQRCPALPPFLHIIMSTAQTHIAPQSTQWLLRPHCSENIAPLSHPNELRERNTDVLLSLTILKSFHAVVHNCN